MRQGTPGFNGKRLKEARETRGLTMTSLADMTGISKEAISRYEKGERDGKVAFTPRPETLDKITNILNFPKRFFFQDNLISNVTPIYYRSLSSATKAARIQAEHKFLWLQEITGVLKDYVDLPNINLPLFDVKDHTKLSAHDIEEFATATRRHWGLGDGPISNIVTLLENNGVVVSRIDLEADTLDALSQWASHDNSPYIYLSSAKSSAPRSKFDISHELAHLTFHTYVKKNVCYNLMEHSIIEKQAHRFASAFLLPARSFANDLVSPTLDAFWALKEKWQVSIKSMIMRCHNLDIIDDEKATKLYMNYNRRGWGKREPLDDRIPIEQPKLLQRSFELLIKEKILTREDITSQLPYPKSILEEIINLPKGFLSIKENNIEYFPSLKNQQNRENLKSNNAKIINFPIKN